MIKLLFIPFILLFLSSCSSTQKHYNEKHYQRLLCKKLNGKMEYTLKDRTRVDCLTNTYAIEVDFAKKWAESIGQSLYYAQITHKKPAIALIVGKKDTRFVKRVKKVARHCGIELFILDK